MSVEEKEKRYIICPICNKTNLAGTKFCEYCWGAALNQDKACTEEELILQQELRARYLKRKKRIRLGILGGIGVAVLVLAILYLASYTDLFGEPSVKLNSNPLPGDWSMFRHDILHSGGYGTTDIVPEGKLKWSYTTNGRIQSSPAVSDGKVYIGSQDHNMYALNAETGNPEWVFETESWVDSSPSVVDGTVYFGSNDSYLYALDSSTGEIVWKYDTPYPVRSSPAIADDVVYFGSDDYYLYALDKDTGKRKWRFDTDSPAGSSPVIQDGLLAYGSSGGYSYILNAATGQLRLKYHPGFTVYASAVMDDGVVYFLTTNGMINAVDQTARTWLREHEIRPYWAQAWALIQWFPKPPEQSGLLWLYTTRKTNLTSPVIENGVMYMGGSDSIFAFNLESREVIWEFETGDYVYSSPALAGDIIYAGSGDGNLYAIHKKTGEMVWKYYTGASITSSPAVVDGVVYVGSQNGMVYAIE